VSLSFFVLEGGGAVGLSLFEMMPELCDQLCLGAVNGRVKFCTLGGDMCSFATHSKKAKVHQGHLYIAGSCNNVYT